MTDYTHLLDAETQAFVARTNAFYPPDAVDHSVAQQRVTYDRMCRAFHAGYPHGVTAQTSAIATSGHAIPVRLYRSATPDAAAIVLYFHGGGFILGGLDSHDDVCADLCAETGFEVFSVDYRLAPEHPYPASHEDGYAAFEWAAERSSQAIVLAGDSAGGNIAAAVAGRYRHHARAPVGQVLVYPGLGGNHREGSYVTHAGSPMLTVRDMVFYHNARTGGADVSRDAGFAPLRDSDFSGLPPTVVVTAECDPLADDGPAYRDAIRAAGGKAMSFEEAGLVHGYLRARTSVARARKSFARIVEAVRMLGHRQWDEEMLARW